jgi:hypothetical protein
MRATARHLPQRPSAPNGEAKIAATYLTGARPWHQTLIAAHSPAIRVGDGFHPTFVDDGSLESKQVRWLLRAFPDASVVRANDAAKRVHQFLPPSEFPALQRARASHTFMRKSIDVRVGSREWQLYLDSDMLFFRPPEFLRNA